MTRNSKLLLLILVLSSPCFCVKDSVSETSPLPGSSSAPDSALSASCADTVFDFAPRTYGVMTVQGFSPIIVRGDKLPLSKTMNYTTAHNYQTQCTIQIYENKSTKIGAFEIKNIPSARMGVEKISVTFEVNNRGILHATGTIVSTGKSEALSLVSSSLNSTVPQRYESKDKTVRLLTPALLGTWFWEVNTDITTLNQSRTHFEAHPRVADLVSTLNNFVETNLHISHFTDASSGWIDYASREAAFHKRVDTTVRRIRSSLIQTDLPHGLQEIHFKAFFDKNIPALIEFLKSEASTPELDSSQTSDWKFVEFLSPETASSTPSSASYKKPISQPSSQHCSDSIYVETLEPDYFASVSGFTEASSDLVQMIQLLNHFSTLNGKIYETKKYGQDKYDEDRMMILDIIRGLTGAQQRRGPADERSMMIAQLARFLRDCKHRTDGTFESILDLLTSQFG